MSAASRPPSGTAGAGAGGVDRLPGLEGKLFDIPENKFIEVVRLLERVRDHPDVRQTFAAIRPRLMKVRPDRRPTMKRVLCMPFEDVLESFSGGDVPLGRIERRVIEPVWRIIEEFGDRHQLDQLDRQVQETAPGNRNALINIGSKLWPMASELLRDVMQHESSRQLLWRLLHGDDDLRRQVEDVATFLEIGLTIEAMKDELSPKRIPTLEDGHVAAIERAAQAAARQSVASVLHLLLVAASRLATPADLLAVLNEMDFGKARRELPVLFAQLSGLVVSNIEERTARLDGTDGAPLASAEEVIAIAERLVASIDTTNAVMDIQADPIYRERLEAVKATVRGMVTGSVLDTAAHNILTAVPPPPRGVRPALVDETAQEAAEDHARALRRCEGLAEALDLHQPLKEAMTAMEKGLMERAQALLAQYPRAIIDPDNAEAAELNLFYALRLLEMVAGPGKADRLREAIMAATGE